MGAVLKGIERIFPGSPVSRYRVFRHGVSAYVNVARNDERIIPTRSVSRITRVVVTG